MLWRREKRTRLPAVPAGQRVYSIGDIHGRFDLLRDLLARIERHQADLPEAQTFLVFLGDLIDRGPDSRTVVEFLSTFRPRWAVPIFLQGNHEEGFLRSLDGEEEAMRGWLEFGGAECAESYGVAPVRQATLNTALFAQELNAAVPRAHLDFLRSFYDSFKVGDYLFVHAGIRPGIPVADQDPHDLRWIRRDFLDSNLRHEAVVVHGHSIVDEPSDCDNRIAIDTGAYRSGCLTAFYAEGTERDFLTTVGTAAGDEVVRGPN
jgi:calcineurin-like phosphoesterase family protein